MVDSIGGMVMFVITIAVMIGIAAMILGNPVAPTADCTLLSGYQPGGVRTVSQPYTTTQPGFCHNSTIINVTSQVLDHRVQRHTFGPMGSLACEAVGPTTGPNANITRCVNERNAQVATLGPTYANFKLPGDPLNGCDTYTLAASTPGGYPLQGGGVPYSLVDDAHQSALGYCFGRALFAPPNAGAFYYMTWTVSNGTETIDVYRNVTTPQQAPPYPCQVQVTNYTTVNTTAVASIAPGTWAAACVEARETAQAGHGLLALIVVVIGAGAVLAALRLLNLWEW